MENLVNLHAAKVVQPLFVCNRWLLLELAPALLLSYVLRDQINRIASRTLISNKKGVTHELQGCDEDRLYVFFHPGLDLSVKHLDLPQQATTRGVRRDYVLVSPVTLGRVANSTGTNRTDGFRRQPLRLSRNSQKDEDCANNRKVATDLVHGCEQCTLGSLQTNLYGHYRCLILLVRALEIRDLVIALKVPDAGGNLVDQIVIVCDQQHRALIPL